MKGCKNCKRFDYVAMNYNGSISNLEYCCYREAIICKEIHNCKHFKKIKGVKNAR